MTTLDVPHHRLYYQRIGQNKFEQPNQVVTWFGAMQAQYYTSVKWAIGLRCAHAIETVVEQAIANKTIIRTWLMRGTLQVVAASDICWMLALLGPRLMANSARRHRQLELDKDTFIHCYEVLTKLLQGGKVLSRAELLGGLEQAGIAINGQRGYHILRHAALEGLICFGPVQDKQETFVLLADWVPPIKKVARDEALAKLAERYFRSHGPATLPDFIWWSGLTVAEARIGLDLAKTRLQQQTVEDEAYYWLADINSVTASPSSTAYLLPAFDEYYLGYKTRGAILDPSYDQKAVSNNGVFRPMVVIDGQIVGVWKQTLKKGSLIITPLLFKTLTAPEYDALLVAANQYSVFLGRPAMLAEG